MHRFSRRDLLQMGAALAAGVGLGRIDSTVFAEGLEKILSRQEKVLWIQGMSCSGCSVSLLNVDEPSPLSLLTELISLVYHSTLSAAQGETAMEILDRMASDGDFYLVLEGAIPQGMPKACMIGGRPLGELLKPLATRAKAIIAAGTCSAFGGIPAAAGNATSAVGMKQYMQSEGIPFANRLVNCPGCPVHPQSLLAVLAYIMAKGYPSVTPELLTPTMIYSHSVHDECPRFHYWEKEVFAEKFGDDGCLFKLGCLGPLSHTDCPRRQWNGGVNWCIRAGAPCIACTSEGFAKRRDFAFYRKGEQYHEVVYHEDERKGL